ncbi:TPA: hypothetical protein ACX8VE_001482 [Campylobacter jejuni]|nr:hypothetical protein [Campylobacter jejuni]
MKFFILIFLTFASLFGKCYYVPCNAQVSSGASKVNSYLQNKFDEVDNSLLVLKEKYQGFLRTIKKNNEILDTKIAIMREKNLKNKKLLFFLKQNISLQSNHNSREGLE